MKFILQSNLQRVKKENSFEIGRNEIKSARKYKNKYFIYQFIGILKDPKILRNLKDPISYMDRDEIIIKTVDNEQNYNNDELEPPEKYFRKKKKSNDDDTYSPTEESEPTNY